MELKILDQSNKITLEKLGSQLSVMGLDGFVYTSIISVGMGAFSYLLYVRVHWILHWIFLNLKTVRTILYFVNVCYFFPMLKIVT